MCGLNHLFYIDPIVLEGYGKVLMNDIAGGGEAELGQEVLHGLRPDLCNGQLFPMVLHPDVSSQL